MVIVQYPVTVSVEGDVPSGGAVSAKTQAYDAGKNTYDASGTATDLTSGGVIYVDSGEGQQDTPTLNVTIPDGYKAQTSIDGGTYEDAGATVSLGKITKDSTVSVKFEKTSMDKFTLTYDANGGSNAPKQEKYTDGSMANLAPAGSMEKSSYVFLGWSATKLADLSATDNDPATITSVEMKANTTVYAIWGIDSNDDGTWDKYDVAHSLIFDLNGGTGSIATQSLKKGEHPTAVTAPTRTNYNFAGWKVTGSNPEQIVQNADLTKYSMPATNTTLVAQWNELGSYTVSFDTLTALKPTVGWPAAQTVAEGGKAASQTVPSISGYATDGKWYTDSDCTTVYNFNTPVTASITLYAKYVKDAATYTVSFQPIGISTKPTGWPANQTVIEGKTATAQTVPTASGYGNDGKWYTDTTCETEYDFSTPVTKDVILYTKYSAITNYTVIFDTMTATKPATWPAMQSVAEGKTVTSVSVPAINGYTTDGKWYTDSACTTVYDFTTPVKANLVLYAKYVKEAATYTVSFESVGATQPAGWPANVNVADGKTVAAPAVPSISGYVTNGKWYSNAACTTEYNFSTPVTKDITLYAKYTPVDRYTVIFDTVTATKPATGWPTNQTVSDGNKISSVAVPEISGYTNDGKWYTDTTYSTAYDFNTPVTQNMTLYAKYDREATIYNVSFEAIGATKPAENWPTNQKVTEGGKLAGVTAPAIEGYSNTGTWYTDAACSNAFDFNTAVTKDLILYTKYSPIVLGEYTVTFDTVTATKPATGWPATQTVTEGNTATSVTVPTLDGVVSDGKWYTDTTYTTVYDFATPVTGSMTLYAKYVSSTGNDPIRAVDTTDPSNTDPSTTNGYLVPGLNGLDENGAGDDQVITPNASQDGQQAGLQNGNLVLPDGGTDTKGNTYAPQVMNNKGTAISYVVFLELKDKDDATKTLTAGGAFETMQYVAAGSDFNTFIPAVDGYKFDSAETLPVPASVLEQATGRTVVTLYYTVVLNTGDPIRAINTSNPADHEPSTTNGFLVPGGNGADENGNNDDIMIIPNPATDSDDTAKIMENTGNLYLPDGGKDYADATYPPCVIDRNGNIVAYLLKVNLVDKNTKAELTAKTMDEPLVFMVDVNANADTGCTLTVPQVKESGYTYDSAVLNGKTLTSLTIPTDTIKAATNKAELLVTLYYVRETVDVTVTLIGPSGDSVFTTTTLGILKDYAAVSGTTNQVRATIKAGIGDVINAPAVSGYSAVIPSSFTLAEGQTKLTFNYSKIVIPSGGGGGGGGGGVTNYALTFNTNGGSTIDAVTKTSGTVITLKDYVPTKPGNTFIGWFSDAALTTAVTSVTLSKNTTVYAKWSGLTNDHIVYLQGYNDGTFKPDKNMTRAEAAVMFYRLLEDKSMTTATNFSDVKSSEWYAQAVQVLASQGIITGFTDGTFRPYANITRAQFAAIASRFENLTSSDKSFSDVPSNYWAYRYINSAATKGWISGYSDGTFRPNQYITRAQVVTMVNNVLERVADQTFIAAHATSIKTFADVSASHWAYWAIEEAANAHDYTRASNDSVEAWTTLK